MGYLKYLVCVKCAFDTKRCFRHYGWEYPVAGDVLVFGRENAKERLSALLVLSLFIFVYRIDRHTDSMVEYYRFGIYI